MVPEGSILKRLIQEKAFIPYYNPVKFNHNDMVMRK
jgi:hypothetical protein